MNKLRRYSSPCRAQALPMRRATWGPRLFNTHGTNKLRRSARRHSPPCRAQALRYLPCQTETQISTFRLSSLAPSCPVFHSPLTNPKNGAKIHLYKPLKRRSKQPMRAQRVREGESRIEMQTAKWTAEGAVKPKGSILRRVCMRQLQGICLYPPKSHGLP